MTVIDPDRLLDLVEDVCRDLDNARDTVSGLAVGLDRGPEAHLVRDLAHDMLDARDLASSIGRDLASAHEVNLDLVAARSLAHDLDSARALARTLSRARNLALTRDLANDLARDLSLVLARVGELIQALEALHAGATVPPPPGASLRVPMPMAGRLTAIAARLLPDAERARYQEEFGSELAEIARTGGRRAQLGYAARTVLSSAGQLRAALRSPRRRGAVQ